MKKLLLTVIIFTGFACKKNKTTSNKPTDPPGITLKCGTILNTPTLDSFVYPTYYITTIVAFQEGNEIVHFHDNVTGDHDSSWYLPKYAKDSSYCTTVP
ncbi:MAG: hypothetical protein KGM16_13440 [Bacteroidota bacterium]|nr:hypothetical protein [Bacteroidota bacterium]